MEGGLKARSARGAIGQTWWSGRFIAVLEAIIVGGRLERGRNYARRGQVLSMDVTAGMVSALVQGSRVQPYRVRVGLDAFGAPEWDAAERTLAASAWYSAKLLAGEMPEDIEDVFAELGLALFPASAAELSMYCSCPDWEVPCKHIAAVFYLLAEAFDDDPFAMLALRGKKREDLLAALRRHGPAVSPAAGSPPRTARVSPAQALLSDVTGVPLEESLADFWSPGLSQARLRVLPPSPVAPPDLLLRLGSPPAVQVRGKPLLDVIAPAYTRLAGSPPAED